MAYLYGRSEQAGTKVIEGRTIGHVPESKEQLITEAIKLHDSGVTGDKEAVVKAHDLWKRLRQIDPQDPLIAAYYGSATSLLGRDAVDPTLRIAKALEGLKILDRVVNKAPEHIQARILRAYVNYKLPEMYFHRTATAIEDFNYLISRYLQDNSIFSPQFYWQILYDLGCAYKQLGRTNEAEATWLKLSIETRDPKYLTLLKQEGIQLPEPPAPPRASTDIPKSDTLSPGKSALPKEGIQLHARALNGDREATCKALDIFSKASTDNPEDFLISAYYADCLSMTARDSSDPGIMFGEAIKAMKILDSCVNARPENLEIRLMRAYHSFRLPEGFFRRTATAIGDFEHCIQRYEQDNTLLPRETYCQLMYDLGLSYTRLGMEEEAWETWHKLLSLNPNPKYRTLIDKQDNSQLSSATDNLNYLNNREELFKEGIRLHDLGVDGNKKAALKAHEILKMVHEKNSGDALVLAYYGSCTALLGRDSTDPTTMFSNAIKGLKMLKQAMGRDWANPIIHLLRGYLAYSLPESFFHLTPRAIKDFRFVKTAYEQDNSIIPQEQYWQILYDLGASYRRVGETVRAKKVWSQLLAQTTDPRYQALIDTEDIRSEDR